MPCLPDPHSATQLTTILGNNSPLMRFIYVLVVLSTFRAKLSRCPGAIGGSPAISNNGYTEIHGKGYDHPLNLLGNQRLIFL
jgi:hypothetical protein